MKARKLKKSTRQKISVAMRGLRRGQTTRADMALAHAASPYTSARFTNRRRGRHA